MTAHRHHLGAALGIAAIALVLCPTRGNAQETIRIERPAAPTVGAPLTLRAVDPDRATVSHVFKLGSAFGDRETFDITLPHAGMVNIHVARNNPSDPVR